MATFSDLQRVYQDTIRVDMKDRWTPQIVKFVHNKNEFYGKFTGNISSIDGVIENTQLKNCKLYDSQGNQIELSDVLALEQRVVDLEGGTATLSTMVYEEVPDWISEAVLTASSGLSTVLIGNFITPISSMLCSEISTRISSDDNFGRRISNCEGNITDIYNRISGLVNYKGELTVMSSYSSFSNLFDANHFGWDDPLSCGWFYVVRSDKNDYYVEGVKVGNGDYIKIDNDTTVGELTKNDVIVTDVMDGDVVHYDAFNRISSLLSSDLSTERGRIGVLSANVESNFLHLSGGCVTGTVSISLSDAFFEDVLSTAKDISVGFDNKILESQENVEAIIAAEISRAISSEGDLLVKIQESQQQVKSIIDAETSRAISSEGEISAELSSLSASYEDFISSTFISSQHEQGDIRSRNLIVTDEATIQEGQNHDQYYLTFKDGTLVLIKKDTEE